MPYKAKEGRSRAQVPYNARERSRSGEQVPYNARDGSRQRGQTMDNTELELAMKSAPLQPILFARIKVS